MIVVWNKNTGLHFRDWDHQGRTSIPMPCCCTEVKKTGENPGCLNYVKEVYTSNDGHSYCIYADDREDNNFPGIDALLSNGAARQILQTYARL